MTTFSALLRWPTGRPFGLSAEALLCPTSSTPDVEVASRKISGCEVAVALRPERKTDRVEQAIFVSPDQHWLAVGDVRLFEAPEAGGVGARSDLERAVRIFSEQGGRGVSRIHGEFAFVIMDWQAGTAQAFRDQLGARPLYFRGLPQGVAFASDLRQL